MKAFSLFILFCVSFFPGSIVAQDYFTSHYNISSLDLASGLPHSNVNHIFADSNGFIWISTYGGGAVRYDGYSFLSPNAATAQTKRVKTSPVSNSCKGFAEDGYQRLWIAYDENTVVLDMHTMTAITPQRVSGGNTERFLKKPSVKVYCDAKGCLWHITNDSIFRYTFDKEGNVSHIASCAYQNNMPDVNICDVDHNGTIWCGVNNSLYRLSAVGKKLIRNEIVPITQQLHGHFVTDMLKDGNTIWISTNQGLYAYDPFCGDLQHYQHSDAPHSISHDFATSLAVTSNGQLVVGTLRGINIMDRHSGQFEHWDSNSSPYPLPSDFIHCMLAYGEQLWIGTETAGIVKMSPSPLMLRNYIHLPGHPESLSPNPVNAMYIDAQGALWAGTVEGGLNRRRPDGGFDHWTTGNSALSHNSVSVLEADNHGTLWIGTWGGGLNAIPLDGKGKLRTIDLPPTLKRQLQYIGSLAYDHYNDVLWVGSNEGVFIYDLKSGNVQQPFQNNHFIRGCIGAHIDRQGQLWMGCINGVCIIDVRKGRQGNGFFDMRRLVAKLDHPQSSVRDKITCFCETRDGTLWLGSNGYGLYQRTVDKKDNRESFHALTTDDGLANNVVKGIVEDEQGRLWITTANGLSIYDTRTRTFINYGKRDGLPSQKFYFNSAVKSKDGAIFLGSMSGLTEVRSQNTETNYPIHLTFTRLSVDNQVITAADNDILDADITVAKRIRLHESNKSMDIDFSALTFAGDITGHYSYRLSGFEDEWIKLKPGEHAVRYTSLQPGSYTFEVRYGAEGNDEVYSTISIKVDVTPYFWKSWWFRVLIVIFCLVAFLWLYRSRLEAWKRQEAEKLLMPIKKVLYESDAPEQLQQRIQHILDNHERLQESFHRSVEVDKQNTVPQKAFIDRATEIMEKNYMNSDFGVAEFAESIGMSRSLVSKHLNAVAGMSTGQFIRNYRLNVAKKLILEHPANRNITEIAYQAGFNDPKYFTRCFTRRYGHSPSTYKESDEHTEENDQQVDENP